jgi:predicted ATP-dependent serine protease
MNNCRFCGHERSKTEPRCPACGAFYPTIADLIAEEEAYEAAHSFRGYCQKIWDAPDRKQALLTELKQFAAGLSTKAWFTLFVIFVFMFALIVTVL